MCTQCNAMKIGLFTQPVNINQCMHSYAQSHLDLTCVCLTASGTTQVDPSSTL